MNVELSKHEISLIAELIDYFTADFPEATDAWDLREYLRSYYDKPQSST